MKKKIIFTLIAALLTMSSLNYAANCGKVNGHKIVTYGGLSCSTAKKVYKSFESGHIPKGWTCGQSVGGCGKGDLGFTFKLN